LLSERFDKYFGDKYATTSKRKRLFNNFFQHKIKINIGNYFVSQVLEEEYLSSVINSFNDTSQRMWHKLTYCLNEEITKFNIEIDISKGENLSPYMQNTFTVRYPNEETPKTLFYKQSEVSIRDCAWNMRIKPNDIKIDLECIENKLKAKLEQLLL
jgi:hypothetical protein